MGGCGRGPGVPRPPPKIFSDIHSLSRAGPVQGFETQEVEDSGEKTAQAPGQKSRPVLRPELQAGFPAPYPEAHVGEAPGPEPGLRPTYPGQVFPG